MRHRTWLLLGLAVSAICRDAAADVIRSDERGAALAITKPEVTAALGDGVVALRVRYDVVNASPFADRARVQLELPTGAVVVGLRQRTGGAWIPGRLEAADAVDARLAAYIDAPFTALPPRRLLACWSVINDTHTVAWPLVIAAAARPNEPAAPPPPDVSDAAKRTSGTPRVVSAAIWERATREWSTSPTMAMVRL